MAISKKAKLACHEYLTDLNWSKAMQRAGYTKSTAENSGSRYFEKPEVTTLINELMTQRIERIDRDADDVLKEFEHIAFSNIMDIFDCDVGNEQQPNSNHGLALKNLNELPLSVSAAIREIKITPVPGLESNKIEIKLHNKHSALEALGRHFQIFDKDSTQSIEFHMNIDLDNTNEGR